MKHPWFKPKKVFGIFAAYYPVTWEAWIITLGTLAALSTVCLNAIRNSVSIIDAVVMGAPAALAILFLFDIISFRTGEYPSWWKKWRKKR